MSIVRDLEGKDYNVVAIIGDGALTGGEAYEGLNYAGDLGKRLIVILNDILDRFHYRKELTYINGLVAQVIIEDTLSSF